MYIGSTGHLIVAWDLNKDVAVVGNRTGNGAVTQVVNAVEGEAARKLINFIMDTNKFNNAHIKKVDSRIVSWDFTSADRVIYFGKLNADDDITVDRLINKKGDKCYNTIKKIVEWK